MSHEKPINYKSDNNLPSDLDRNHTFFLLVDDGTKGRFGGEIEFRAMLEPQLRRKWPLQNTKEPEANKESKTEELTPIVSIVIGGGPGTIK